MGRLMAMDRRTFLSLLPGVAALLGSKPAGGRQSRPLILLWLGGGASPWDTFNPQPQWPAEMRGPFTAIPTSVPGVHVSELFPQLARQVHRLALVRAVSGGSHDHFAASEELLMEKQQATAARVGQRGVGVPYSLIWSDRGTDRYISGAHRPTDAMRVDWDKESGRFAPAQLGFAGDLASRRELLRAMESGAAQNDRYDRQRSLALDLSLGGGGFREAFDLPESARDRYGGSQIGDACLLANRLIERDAGAVTINYTTFGWDIHEDCADRTHKLARPLDAALASLVSDLHDAECTVVVAGEFGRTPRLNAKAGRDHWPYAHTALLCGAGIQPDVWGCTDRHGKPREKAVPARDLRNTALVACGVPLEASEQYVRQLLAAH